MVLWVLTIFSVGLALAANWKYRMARENMEAQDRVWREAMRALQRRDYGAARALAANRTGSEVDEELLNALKEAADALEAEGREQERARRELADVLASLQDAVLVVDGEAHLRFLNAAALSLFGIRVEDVLGAALLEALPSFGLDDAVREALREGRSSARETALYAPQTQARNGNSANGVSQARGRRDVLLRVAPVRRSDGRVTGAVAILQDLTEMRRLERVRREFVANASHELRTPVANIRASAETILEDPDDAVLRARFLPHLVSEAERLSRLISDLLDLARVESHLEAARAPVDLCRVAQDVMERLKPKAAQHDLKVSFQCDDCCAGAPISGDEAGLDQVAFNLLDNALMYTPGGGSVEIGVRALHDEGANDAGDENQSTGVALWVRDTGIGIPSEDLPRVFERFYRVDKARSRAQGGTGLGLAIVKHIVENHGGHIKVESEPGQGTTFTVTLPKM